MFGPCQIQLTCASQEEAKKVAEVLLKKRLVACVKMSPVSSTFWWKGEIETDNEIMLFMESKLEHFDEIELEVGKHHSYKTYVLQAVPLAAMSNKAYLWLNKEVRPEAKKGS